ncbi:MAG: hypothetical protein ACKESC_01575 [Candidatus Hodgkinia cicadicola]
MILTVIKMTNTCTCSNYSGVARQNWNVNNQIKQIAIHITLE